MGDTLSITGVLPKGVTIAELQPHVDERGSFCEIFRATWDAGIEAAQWSVVTSAPRVLRGVHVHPRHDDYVVLLQGAACFGLRDLRAGSSTEGAAALIHMTGNELAALRIPHGVAHGFYFFEQSTLVYAASQYYDPADELGCRWSDHALEIPWPVTDAILSARDAGAPPLEGLLELLRPFQPISVT